MNHTVLPHHHEGQDNLDGIESVLLQLQRFGTVAEVFKQLSDPTRIRIFWLLCHTEQCVINISAMMAMSSPAVSHHLRTLRSCNLIVSRRKGKEVYYCASENPQAQLLHQTLEQMMAIACPEVEEGNP